MSSFGDVFRVTTYGESHGKVRTSHSHDSSLICFVLPLPASLLPCSVSVTDALQGVGAIVENVPPGLHLTEADIQTQLDRRCASRDVTLSV